MRTSYLAGAGVCAFCAVMLAGQETVAVSQGEGATPGNGRLRLAVVANDKSGRPVAGLQQQDFTIVENGNPQKVVSFEAARSGSNDDCQIILVIDTVNTPFTKVAYARDQVTKFLREDAGKLARPVSISFLADKGIEIPQNGSSDGNALATALERQESALRTLRRSQGIYGAADRSDLSLRALGQLAEFESKRNGRKLVVWIGPGWPLLSGPRIELSTHDQQSIFTSIVAISSQLQQANITLYNVDPFGTEDAGGFRTSYFKQFLKGVTSPKQVYLGDLGLQVLAVHSGGRVFNSSNDVTGEIARCVRDSNAYYVLSYDPTPADGPNNYRAIEVKIARPQTKAQTLAGYYAQPVGK